jgi:hypothetical protein
MPAHSAVTALCPSQRTIYAVVHEGMEVTSMPARLFHNTLGGNVKKLRAGYRLNTTVCALVNILRDFNGKVAWYGLDKFKLNLYFLVDASLVVQISECMRCNGLIVY